MKPLRVLVLMDPALVPPDSTKGYTAQEVNEWKTEFDIVSTLRAAGHDVRPFGVRTNSRPCATRSRLQAPCGFHAA